jgi:ABC-2 type transport system ATP-binding protein
VTATTRAVIDAVGVHKRYGPRQVLHGLDLQVHAGEVLCLLGPNGAGKTTTVEILEGHRTADAGHLRVLGMDPAAASVELRARTGVVLQECGLPQHLRVGELLDGWRAYYPAPRSRTELLELVELTGDEATLVRRLSGGQRRRLDLALALAGRPELVFLDEPTTGFDPEARRRCWAAIKNLRATGTTIVLTTHYLDEAEHLADRVALLHGGRIQRTGTPTELARAAALPYRISFRAPPELQPGAGSEPGIELVIDGPRAVVASQDPSATLRVLHDMLGHLEDLTVAAPSLEDAYLALIDAPTVSA